MTPVGPRLIQPASKRRAGAASPRRARDRPRSASCRSPRRTAAPGQRQPAVADAAEDELARDRLALVGRLRATLPAPVRTSSLRTSSTPSTRSSPRIATRRDAEAQHDRGAACRPARAPRSSRRMSTFRWTMFEAAARARPRSPRRARARPGRRRCPRPRARPSRAAPVDVHGGLHGAAPAEDDDLADRASRDGVDRLRRSRPSARAPRGVSASMRATSSATLPLPTTTARSAARGRTSSSWIVGVAVVPGDELGRRPRAAAGPRRGSRAACRSAAPYGVDDRVVQPREVLVREIAPDLDVAEKAEAGLRGDLLERARDRLELRMVGRDAEPDEAPRRRQPLDHVDLERAAAAAAGPAA